MLSLQVLQEYFVILTRKLHVDAAVARRKVELLAEFDVVAPDLSDILAAIDLHRLHGISFWDALIIQSAKQSGCSILLSEDSQGQRELEGAGSSIHSLKGKARTIEPAVTLRALFEVPLKL